MRKGFTLIELLIVIGILAVLAVAVVLVLNPAQLLAQARDSQRISDFGSVKSAVGLYLATATSTTVNTSTTCTVTSCVSPFATSTLIVTSSTVVSGGGWVAVDLTGTTGGSPLATLPLDPTNSTTYYYAFKGYSTDKTYELDARLESTKYRDMMITDGGNNNSCTTYTENVTDATAGTGGCYYETGTDPALNL